MKKEEQEKIIKKIEEYSGVLNYYADVADWDLADILTKLEDAGLLHPPKSNPSPSS